MRHHKSIAIYTSDGSAFVCCFYDFECGSSFRYLWRFAFEVLLFSFVLGKNYRFVKRIDLSMVHTIATGIESISDSAFLPFLSLSLFIFLTLFRSYSFVVIFWPNKWHNTKYVACKLVIPSENQQHFRYLLKCTIKVNNACTFAMELQENFVQMNILRIWMQTMKAMEEQDAWERRRHDDHAFTLILLTQTRKIIFMKKKEETMQRISFI